ncbi:MAG: class I SAM-dependent methyltransferase [Candidatus Lokiarchaeota archaeon]|nr:class I SAM-dependent methyltransferase [Candidatus Lokiarchaeota archaeon]
MDDHDHKLVWDASLYQENSSFQFSLGLDAIARLAPRPGERVLDIGCGNGATTAELARRVLPGGEVVGMDVSSEMLAQARANIDEAGLSNVRLVHQDMATLAIVGGFDAVFSNSSVHWVSRLDDLYRRVHAALVPGGRVVVQTGAAGGNALVDALHDAMAEPLLATLFAGFTWPWQFCTPAEAERILEEAGFSAISVEAHDKLTSFPTEAALIGYCRAAALIPFLSHLPEPRRPVFLECFARHLLARNGARPLDLVMPRLFILAAKP